MNNKRISVDELNISIAKLLAKRSRCSRLDVGCIITRDRRIIASGCNGPSGKDYDCKFNLVSDKCLCDVSLPCVHAIHAEANAIAFAAKEGLSLKGSTIYCTHSPCIKCSELIKQSGIIEVVYELEFRSTDGLKYLDSNGIQVRQYS